MGALIVPLFGVVSVASFFCFGYEKQNAPEFPCLLTSSPVSSPCVLLFLLPLINPRDTQGSVTNSSIACCRLQSFSEKRETDRLEYLRSTDRHPSPPLSPLTASNDDATSLSCLLLLFHRRGWKILSLHMLWWCFILRT
jgi:hypothetical protein